MSSRVDDALAVFRGFDSVALGVLRRTGSWTDPVRVVRYAAEIKDGAPKKLHGVLDSIFFGAARQRRKVPRPAATVAPGAQVEVPTYLVRAVQQHLVEFSHLYSLSRSDPNLYSYQMLKNLDRQWPSLKQALLGTGVPLEAVEQIERHMLERMNHLLQRLDFPAGKPAVQAVKFTPEGDAAGRQIWTRASEWARKTLKERGLPARALEDAPFDQLDPFGKLLRLFPEGDPAWREMGEFLTATEEQFMGRLGEMIAIRTPAVMDFVQSETKRILREQSDLVRQGWRVVFEPRSARMAQRAPGMEAGGAVPGQGLPGSGLSFDFSVWLVKDETAMPILRGQVKSGKETNAVSGVSQSLDSDEWRGFSDFVDLVIDGVPRRLALRPPDTYNVVRVLVVAKDPPMKAIAGAVPVGASLDVIAMPLTAQELGKIGGALQDTGRPGR